MSKAAEELILLNDGGRGLLAKAYNLSARVYSGPPSLTAEMDKVCRLLVKRFPDHPSELERTPGNEAFAKAAKSIAADAKNLYTFYINLMAWSEKAWLLLKDISQNVVSMRFGQNTDLMALFNDLLVLFAKVHILAARCDKATLYLSVYARAYHLNTGNSEPNFLRVATYVEKYRDDPLRELQDRCAGFGLSVGDTLMGTLMTLSKWSDPATLQNKGTFSVLDDSRGMVDETRHFTDLQELQFVDRAREWVLWGFLLCPAELKKDNALTLLGLCLKETAVLRVARDEYLDVHRAYSGVFDTFRVDKWKLSKHKKTLKDAAKDFVAAAVPARRAQRTFLRVELERLGAFFTEFPHALAPKLHLVYSLLRLVRGEVEWYFDHIEAAPRMHKGVQERDLADDRISDLVYGISRMDALVRANAAAVSDYYLGVLRDSDGPDMARVVDEFSRGSQVSAGLQQLLSSLTGALASPSAGDDYEAFRLNWYRVSATINSQQSGLVARGADKLNAVMNRAVVHTRCVDRVQKQLAANASLHELFWHQERLAAVLQASLSLQGGQPRHCMALVQVLNEGLRAVHKLCPEEQSVIGERSVAAAEQFLKSVMRAVAGLVQGLFEQYSVLSAQTHQTRVVDLLRAEQQGKAGPLPPGYESLMGNRAAVATLAGWSKVLAEICEAVRETDELVVYNTEFVPREFLYATMRRQFTDAVVRCLRRGENDLARPSEMLRSLRLTVQAYHAVDSHCNLNMSDIVRLSLRSLFYDPRTGSAGESMENLAAAAAADGKAADAKQQEGALMTFVINFYIGGVLKNDLQSLGITYSPLRQGFVTHGAQAWKAEDFMQISELICLCRLIGPSGFRAFERRLLGEVVAAATLIKERLAKMRPMLETLREKFTDSATWYEQVSDSSRSRGLGKVVQVGVSLGVLLRFRTLLRQAMRQVSAEAVPYVLQAVESLHAAKPPGQQSLALTALEVLATDIGAEMGNTDQGLRQALAPLKTSAQDEQLWALLPELFGATFVTEVWKSSTYMVSTESHNSNVHCMAAAVSALIASFERVPVDNRAVPEDVEERTRDSLVRFARCAASSILHMNSSARRQQFSSFPMPSIMVFVEQFVSSSGLQLSVLEDFFPYSLLRTHYIQMYEAEAAARGRSGGPVGGDGDEDQRAGAPGARA